MIESRDGFALPFYARILFLAAAAYFMSRHGYRVTGLSSRCRLERIYLSSRMGIIGFDTGLNVRRGLVTFFR